MNGYFFQENYLSQQQCQDLLSLIADYRQKFFVPKIYRDVKPIPLSYSVIDGKAIKSHLLEIQQLYHEVNQFINNLIEQQLVPLQNTQVGCNVNITEKGGTYRWHYDRNLLTAILYLNEVEGGEIVLYPDYRILLPQGKFSIFQSFLDGILRLRFIRNVLGRKIIIKPQPGLLLLMYGNKCLHSVCPVRGIDARINIVMSYDFPEASFEIENQLDSYLYSSENVEVRDPNYLNHKLLSSIDILPPLTLSGLTEDSNFTHSTYQPNFRLTDRG